MRNVTGAELDARPRTSSSRRHRKKVVPASPVPVDGGAAAERFGEPGTRTGVRVRARKLLKIAGLVFFFFFPALKVKRERKSECEAGLMALWPAQQLQSGR